MIDSISDYELSEIKSKIFDGDLGFPFTPQLDVASLIWIAGKVQGNIVEAGCNVGGTTRYLALAFPDRIVYGVDCLNPPGLGPQQLGEIPKVIGEKAKALANVRIIESDFPACSPDLFDNVGFCFVDSDHSYDGVKRATEKALGLLQNNAAIAWHDFSELDVCPRNPWVGVGRYLRNELSHLTIRAIPGTSLAFALVDNTP